MTLDQFIETADDGIDPIKYVNSHFSQFTDREISVLVGAIALFGEVEYKLLTSVLNLKHLQLEEKIGRLMQTDLLDGKFTDYSFQLEKFNYKIKKQHPNLTLDDRTLLAYLKARFEVSLEELVKTFDLSYESIVFLISSFVSRGLISTQKITTTSFQFVVHYHHSKKTVETITESEKQIAGYGILRGKITIKEIAHDLAKPEHKVISTVVSMILSDMVIARFHRDEKIFGGMELFVEIDRLQIHFDKQSIALLSDQERRLIGYTSLRKRVSLREIQSVIQYSPVTSRKIASILVATKNFNFTMTQKDILEVEEIRAFSPSRSLETLTTIYGFNYRILLGLLKTQKKITIKEIAKKMAVNEQDVILGLINSYVEGMILGYLDNKNVFSLRALRTSVPPGEFTLEVWERIILGALISESVISWPKIAALLDVDRSVARNRAFEFISRGIANTEAKDTVLALEEIPSLPPLVQLSNLDKIEQEIFGYLISTNKPNLKKVKTIFNLSTIQAFRYTYFLCGSGLFILKRKGDELILTKSVSFEPTASVNELSIEYQNLIRYIQSQQNVDRFNLSKIRRELKISNKEIIRMLSFLIAHGYYRGKLLPSNFLKESRLLTSHLVSTCLYCNSNIENPEVPCFNCSRIQPFCGVCKGHLNSSEQLVACPHCQNLSHSLHLRQWLKIKGECPFCRNKITERDLQVRQPLL